MGDERMAFLISGGKPLYGNIRAQGAKNAALPMLFATLLCHDPVTLYGVPDIGDVRAALSLLGGLGVVISHDVDGSLTLDAADARLWEKPLDEVKEIRASSYLLGVGLGCFGSITLHKPGGCDLGPRPLDIHKGALLALGAAWEEEEGRIRLSAPELKGARILLPYPSVGATVNALLAALFAKGKTEMAGIFESQTRPLTAIQAKRMGKAAFLDPCAVISPTSAFPPLM